MRINRYSPGLAALMATVGLAAAAPLAGCGGDAVTISPPGAGGSGGQGGGGSITCGNGKLEDNEACDDANLESGDGCDADCSFTCNNTSPATGDAKCDDADPCNGKETCLDNHTCSQEGALPDGTECDDGKVCIAGICSPDQCGDQFTSKDEECDDGNVTSGDGCDGCKFSCVSTDPLRDCSSLDPCVGTVCDDATHTCEKPLGEGAYCGQGQVCKSGVCSPTVCGDGVPEFGEVCDDGNLVDADGCDADCTLSCVNPATDCPAAPTCQIAACAANVCTTNEIGMDPACIPPSTCQNGACQAPNAVCGNGFLEPGEDCDFGGGNGPNTGCETNCKFSCLVDADCVDTNTCNGTETCIDVTVVGQAGKQCLPGLNESDCSVCAGGLCGGGTCSASTCGDGCVDTTAGEECEPPGSVTCDGSCKTIIVSVCGNGTREASEQCDDGNKTNLDGCNATCGFEQIHRVNWLAMQFGTDAYCTANRLGSAIASAGQSTISDAITASVNDGSISVIFQFLYLDDLSGTNDSTIAIGSMQGAPIVPAGTVYNGASDLDWWYTIDTLTLDASRVPTAKLNGSIAAKTLNAGPGSLFLTINLGGSPATLSMSNVKITSPIGNVGTPLVSMMGNPPGHLPAENLDPALQSFATMAQPTANGAGKLCGNVSAASLDQVPVPAALLSGSTACSQGYNAANSLLDVIVGGCTALGIIPVINARQPDTHDPNITNLGAGPPYTFTRDNATKQVNGCRDVNNQVVSFDECLQDAAYSAFFKLATDRVIGK